MNPRGRTALVTGAAAGTGRAIATRLAAEGAKVIVADVDEAAGGEAAAGVGGSARFGHADVTRDEDLRRLIGAAGDDLQILVNNAGGGGHIPPHFPDATPDQWTATLDLNLRAAMLATQLCLVPMRENGGGVIVNIASTAGLGLAPHASPEYAAAKAGLIRFTSTLAPLHERMNIRVHCLVPDWIATERAQRELAEMTPDQRGEAPTRLSMEAIADAAMELIGNERLTGRVIVLMGGEEPRLLDP